MFVNCLPLNGVDITYCGDELKSGFFAQPLDLCVSRHICLCTTVMLLCMSGVFHFLLGRVLSFMLLLHVSFEQSQLSRC